MTESKHRSPWSIEDKRLLIELSKEGVSLREIGERLGRNEKAIRTKYYALGLAEKRTRKWTREEQQVLEGHLKNGLTWDEISREMNRGVAACRSEARVLGFKRRT
jgi:DNA-binding NarL/FixJ family response regulator